MTYWTVVPNEEERSKKPTKVFKQFSKPRPESDRVKGYPWIHGHPSKKDAIEHLNTLGVPNKMRPAGFKSYDA